MKRILFVAHMCFPVMDAESIVNARLLSVLSRSGEFKIDLITKKQKWQNYPSDTLEEYGIKLNSIHFVEVDNRVTPATVWQHFLAFVKFGVVGKGYHWAYKSLKVIKPLVKVNKYDYVLTKASPSYVVGNYLKRYSNLKWVCTWNDPMPEYPKPYGKGNGVDVVKKNASIIRIMKNADVFIYPNNRLATYMNKYLNASNEAIYIIPHVMIREPEKPRISTDGPIKLIHSGNCTGNRKALCLLKALKELIDDGKLNSNDFTLSFLGKVNYEEVSYMNDMTLKGIVKVLSPVSYLQSLNLLLDYDIAIIIEADWEEGVFLPTKVSDFMMQGKRIFSISPQNGVLHDLYNLHYISYFAELTSIQSIKDALLQIKNDREKMDWYNYKVNIPEDYLPNYVVNKYLSF